MITHEKHSTVDYGSPDSTGGAFLRYLRLQRDITQADMAKRFKLSIHEYGLYERGYKPISKAMASVFADYFDTVAARFYGSS